MDADSYDKRGGVITDQKCMIQVFKKQIEDESMLSLSLK